MADVLDIKEVPPSPGTGLEPIKLFNPLSEDFTWSFDGKPYTIAAKTIKEFPEFLANHLAKHLARKIVYSKAYKEIEKAAKGQLTPDTAKAVPDSRVERMINWLLNPIGKSPEGEEEPSQETKLPEALTEAEKKVLENYRKKVANIAKAREAKAGK